MAQWLYKKYEGDAPFGFLEALNIDPTASFFMAFTIWINFNNAITKKNPSKKR
ncbi:MAG: hypothetical protein LDLANPLL_00983 [Turneriella sp.]|nr:hypothetical protein [Turneriella sp.]